MPWFQVNVVANSVVAVEANSAEEAMDGAMAEVFNGFEVSDKEAVATGPFEGEALASVKRHANVELKAW